jgi:AMP-polyphosphate phosphotransferase
MFEVFESGSKISKKDYKKRLPELRAELLQTQFALQKENIPLLIIAAGVEGAGKGDVVNRLNSWMDTRYIETNVFRNKTDDEASRPGYWRYWRVLPSGGKIGVFFGSWYTRPIKNLVFGEISSAEFDAEMSHIRSLEQMLAAGGMLIVKFWLHISEKEQKFRFELLEKDERTKWRITDYDWRYHNHFDRFIKAAKQAIRQTDTADSPWNILDASQERYRDIAFMETLLRQMKAGLNRNGTHKKAKSAYTPQIHEVAKPNNILDHIDVTPALTSSEYKTEYKELSLEIEYLAWQCYQNGISSVIVFEGWDAAGKGGIIRRLVPALDAKLYRVIQISAPNHLEKSHHYLWRFWQHIPKDGNITIYDRSWYGRVLVERVEGFAAETEWSRSYHEINEFEQQLIEHGTLVSKFWLHISSNEQLRRFKERQKVEYKKHKITDEDWRNREKREAYKTAVHDMIAKTSTEYAPWHVIPANSKNYARITVLKIIRDSMKSGLERKNGAALKIP